MDLTEVQKRKLLLPHIRTATNCIANAVKYNAAALNFARYGQWDQALSTSNAISLCANELNNAASWHDYYHGPGTGFVFLKGPYISDLPRAISTRIKPDIDRFVEQENAERQQRERERLAAERAARQRELEQQQVADAKTAVLGGVISEFYECVEKGAATLVTLTSENADTIVDASITKCAELKERFINTSMAVFELSREDATVAFTKGVSEKRAQLIAEVVTIRAKANLDLLAKPPESRGGGGVIEGNDGLRPAARQF